MAQAYGIGLICIATDCDWDRLCHGIDGLIVPGSPINISPTYYGGEPFDPPEVYDEYALDSKVIGYFAEAKKPMFGICGGIQALNVFFGGTLKKVEELRGEGLSEPHGTLYDAQDRYGNPLRYRLHPILVEEDSFVYDVFGKREVLVNSYHDWALDRVAEEFRVVARTRDDNIIEAFECKERRVYGTQWHPELAFRMGFEKEMRFFENFLKVCEENA